jgi:hypothetical protein
MEANHTDGGSPGFAIPGNRVEQVVNQLTGGGVHTVSASTSS